MPNPNKKNNKSAKQLALEALAEKNKNEAKKSTDTGTSSTSKKNSLVESSVASKAVSRAMSDTKSTTKKISDTKSKSTPAQNALRTLEKGNNIRFSDQEKYEANKRRGESYLESKRQFREEHPVGQWLGSEAYGALTGFNSELASTADFLLPDVITPKKVQGWLDYYDEANKEQQKVVQENRAGSLERQIVGNVGGEGLKNIPSLVMAMMTGGLSKGAQVGGQAVQSLLNPKELTHAGNTITRALNDVAKVTGDNPMFWETFMRTVGPTYDNEMETNGGDTVRATISAFTNAFLNSMIEVGGGVQVYDPSETFLQALIRTAKEEGSEEIQQYAVENLVNKALGSQHYMNDAGYLQKTPWFSWDNPDAKNAKNLQEWIQAQRGSNAVINPVDMAEQGFYGALSGGLMGGGRTAIKNVGAEALNAIQNPVSKEEFKAGMANPQSLVNKGLVQGGSAVSSKAQDIAKTMQAQLDSGKDVEVYQVKELLREINKENKSNDARLVGKTYQEANKSVESGNFVEATGTRAEVEGVAKTGNAVETRNINRARSVLGENATNEEVNAVAKVDAGTATSREINTILASPQLRNAVEKVTGIEIPQNNEKARQVIEDITAMHMVSNRNNVYKTVQKTREEEIKASLVNLNEGGKDLFVKNAVAGKKAIGNAYTNRFYRLFSEGAKNNSNFTDAYKRLITPLGADVEAVFTKDFARQIFEQGRASALAENIKVNAKNVAKKYANRTSGLTFENNDTSLVSKNEAKQLEKIAKKTGIEIRIMKSITPTDKDGKLLVAKDGTKLTANGMYQDGIVYIASDTKNKLITVAKHELTHHIAETSPEMYKKLEDFVFKKWFESDKEFMAKTIEAYQDRYGDITPEEAREEIIADCSEAFFTDKTAVQEAIEFSVKLGRAIHAGIKSVLNSFVDLQDSDSRTTRGYGQFLKEMGILKDAERMWAEALNESAKAKAEAKTDANGNALSKGQQEFFANSKVVDKNGRLKPMYHGTSSEGFTVFDINRAKNGLFGKGFYFTDSKSHASQYGKTYTVYLDIETPLQAGTKSITKDQLRSYIEYLANNDEDYGLDNYGYNATVDSVLNSVWGKDDFNMLADLNTTAIGNFAEAVQLFNKVVGVSYDGIIAPTETIAFYPEQIKETDNLKPTKNPDMRFSLSEPAEETKELLAVHNLKENDVRGALDLGGFPMPSIAIIKASAGHNAYGEYSAVFDKSTIDPSVTKRNVVYGGDAWTPTFPSIRYKANDRVSKKISQLYYDRAKELGYDVMRPLQRLANEPNEELDSVGGEAELKEAYKKNVKMMRMFLRINGKDVKDIINRTEETLTDNEVRIRQHFVDYLGEKAIREFEGKSISNGPEKAKHRIEWVKSHKTELENAYADFMKKDWGINEEGAQEILKDTKLIDLMKFVRDAMGYLNDGLTIVRESVDEKATENAVRTKAKKQGYDKWVDDLLNGIEEKKGIRNNTDMFTRSGNRRSWEALHDEPTLLNLVRVMSAQDNGETFLGSSLKAVAQKQYKNISEIKADSGRLKTISEEEYKKLMDGFAEREYDIITRIDKASPTYESNPFIRHEDIRSSIVDNVRRGLSKTAFLKDLQQYGNTKGATAKDIDDIFDLVRDVANIPTGYFEAKPKRPVTFNEVKALLAPSNAPADLISRLQDEGVNVVQYEAGDEEDRIVKLNEASDKQNLKFSLTASEEQDGMIVQNGTARWTDKRIRRLMDQEGGMGNYSSAYAVMMNPRDFLKLTLSDGVLDDWNNAVKNNSLVEKSHYNVRSLNKEDLEQEGQTPYLRIYSKDGTMIQGHEGRHRMRALMEEGVKSVPVVLVDTDTKYSKAPIGEMTLSAQDFGYGAVNKNAKVTVKDLVPIRGDNFEELQAKFGGEADLKFSISTTEEVASKATKTPTERGIMSKKDISNTLKENFNGYENDRKNLKIATDAIYDLQNIVVREDSATRQGRSMVGDSDKARHGSGRTANVSSAQYRTVAKGITTSLVKEGYIDFRGQEVNNPEDLAKLCQALRDPRFETFRIVLTKGNKIVSFMSISSRLPATSFAFEKPLDVSGSLDMVKDRMKRTGADGYYLLHNHPSGNVKASTADLVVSARYINALGRGGYKGHVILDHDKFGLIEDIPQAVGNMTLPTDREVAMQGQQTIDLLHIPEIDHPVLGETISRASDVARVGFAVNAGKDYSVLVYITSQGKVQGVQEIHNKTLTNNKGIRGFIRNQAVEFGTSRVFLFLPEKDTKVALACKEMFEDGIFSDIVLNTSDSFAEMLNLPQYGDPTTLGISNQDIASKTRVFESMSGSYGYVKYTKKQYNDFGWAYGNGKLTRNEYDSWNEQMHNKSAYTKSYDGSYIIPVGDEWHVRNVLVYSKGSWNNPVITKVVRINTEIYAEYALENVRDAIYEAEKIYRDAVQYVAGMFETGFIAESVRDDMQSYSEYSRGEERSGSPKVIRFDENENGRGSVKEPVSKYQLTEEANPTVAKLEQKIADLKAEFKRTDLKTADPKQTKIQAGKLLRRHDANMSMHSDLVNSFNQIFKLYQDKGLEAFDEASEIALQTAEKIVDTVAIPQMDQDTEAFNEVKHYLRTTPIRITEEMKRNITDYNDFRRRNFGRLRLVADETTNLDKYVFPKLAELMPSAFDIDTNNVYDMLDQIEDVFNSHKQGYETIDANSAEGQEYIGDIASDILETAYDLKVKKTFADKKYEEKQRAIQRERAKVRSSREKARARREESEARTKLLNIARRLSKVRTNKPTHDLIMQYVGELDLVAKSMTGKTVNNLFDLLHWYHEQQQADPYFYDSNIEKKLERLSQTQISKISIEEVRDLTEVLRGIEASIRNGNKFVDSKYKKTIIEAGKEVIKDVDKSVGINRDNILGELDKFFINGTLSPERQIHRIVGYNDNDPLYIATKELSKGQRDMLTYQMKSWNMFKKFTKDEAFVNSLNGKNAREIVVIGQVDGKTKGIKVTPDVAISLYLSSLNEDNLRHMGNGGVNIPDFDLYRKGKLQSAYDNATLVTFSKEQLSRIRGALTAKEKEFMNTAYEYYNSVAPENINRVSEILKGYSIARVHNYFPINVDDSFLAKDFESLKFDGTIEGMGSLKERVVSTNPIVINGIVNTLTRSIQENSMYVGLAIPVRNFNKLLGVKDMTYTEVDRGGKTELNVKYNGSVNKSIKAKWGMPTLKYIEKMMTDLQRSRHDIDDWEESINKLRSNYAGAVLTLNLSVALKQTASYPTAVAVLGLRPTLRALGNIGKVNLDLIEKYTPLQWYRSQGYSMKELGDIKAGRKDSLVDKTTKYPIFNWIQAMDVLTTRKLWKASEYYVRQHNKALKVGTEEYYKAVAEIYNRVIEETQPNYTTMQRPQLLRADGSLVQTLNMFKTQPFQNFNILYDAVGNYTAKAMQYKTDKTTESREKAKEAYRDMQNAVLSQFLQLAVFASMTFAWAFFRGKDDKWRDEDGNLTLESFLKRLGYEMMSGTFAMFPLGADIFSLATHKATGDYYSGFQSVTDSSINDLFNTGSDLVSLVGDLIEYIKSDNKEEYNTTALWKQFEKVIKEWGRFAGIPTQNMKNLFDSVYRWAMISANGKYIGEYEALKETLSKDSVKKENLLKAYQNDHVAYLELRQRMIEDGFDAEKLNDYMGKYEKEALFDAYRNDEQRYEELRQEMIDEGYSEESLDDYIGKQKKENKTDEEQTEYDNSMQIVESSPLWADASEKDRERFTRILEKLAVGEYDSETESITKKATDGLTEEQVVLYKLALKKADQPNASGNYGTYTKAEKEEALRMLEEEFGILTEEQKKALKG